MQPLLRQTPPKVLSFSTNITSSPKSEALNAAVYPPGPDPITTTFVFMLLIFVKVDLLILELMDCR